jgi:hypothetical protein
MKLLLRCVVFSTVFTVLIAGLLLRTAWSVPSALMLPALWLTDKLFGSSLATSDSGLNNFIALVLASCPVNIGLYTLVFFLFFRAAKRVGWHLQWRRT